MKINMIVADLDDTLLRRDKTVSDFTAGVLRRCQKRGIVVAFATARSYNSSRRIIDIIRPDGYTVNGGAETFAGGGLIHRSLLDTATVNTLIRRLRTAPGIGYITLDNDDGYFVSHEVDPGDSRWTEYLPAYQIDFSQQFNCPANKITVQLDDTAVAHDIISGLPDVGVIVFSGDNWHRFANKEATKWLGVQALAAHFGIDTANVAAFGDDFNDIEMLRRCGCGVAMGNAVDEAKDAARYTCADCDDDGMARWIECNVLNTENNN